MEQKLSKEAFVSNLNGTTLTENSVGLVSCVLSVAYRDLILMYFFGESTESPWKRFLFIDFVVLVAPLVLYCTVLSAVLHWVVLVLVVVLAISVFQIYYQRKRSACQHLKEVAAEFLETSLVMNRNPFVTSFRVYVNIVTAICILAVDFPIFPRRFAKTETYGKGYMDYGAAAFVFLNALVSPEARQRNKIVSHFKISFVVRQVIAVWPLIFLGFVRLISVKSVNYHEHISEYGLHWNFFFTLAVVRILSSIILVVCPIRSSWILSSCIALCYQFLLETTNLKQFILHGSDGKGTRDGFINANREGIFSMFGYVSIYMAGVQVGIFIMKRRMLVKDWIKVMGCLAMSTFVLLLLLHACEALVEPVSRRMANLAFVLWTVEHSLVFISLHMLVDLVLLFVKFLSGMPKAQCSWNILPDAPQHRKEKTLLKNNALEKADETTVRFCLIDAINRNQLLFFLQCNILTGLVNLTVVTVHSSTFISLFVLMLYMFCNCITVYILHINDITIKFW
ncbi:phosphatidylinositol-glycan biosynthesis class W protein [Rhinoraja longicauda]